MHKTKVAWFNASKGHGFLKGISASEDKDIFVHYSALRDSDFRKGLKDLDEGQEVTFDLIHGPKGPLATNVRVLKNG
jgi:CspA family cold shock protein